MFNPTARYVPFTVAGETVQLAFDFNAIASCEQACGVNLFQAIGLAGNSARQWQGLLWAALLPAQPKATLQDAGNLMQAALYEKGKLEELYEAINSTITASMPDAPPNPPTPDSQS